MVLVNPVQVICTAHIFSNFLTYHFSLYNYVTKQTFSQTSFINFVLKFGCYQTLNFIYTLSHSQTWFISASKFILKPLVSRLYY